MIYRNDIYPVITSAAPSEPFPPLSILFSALPSLTLLSSHVCLSLPCLHCVITHSALMSPSISSAFDLIYTAGYPLFAVFFGAVLVQQWLSYRRLSDFKGPFWASWTSLWLVGIVNRRKTHLELYETYLQYGSPRTYPSFMTLVLIRGRRTCTRCSQYPHDR